MTKINSQSINAVITPKINLSASANIPEWLQGPKGDTGSQGAPGNDGYTPIKGLDYWTNEEIAAIEAEIAEGVTQGVKGDVGASAYEVAVAAGFIGTEAAWIASLKGAQGDKGNTGPSGLKGDTGPKGEPGIQGAAGAPGKDGEQGAIGPKGEDGAPGAKGENGADGYTPIKGTDYFTAAEVAQVTADAAAAVDLSDYRTLTNGVFSLPQVGSLSPLATGIRISIDGDVGKNLLRAMNIGTMASDEAQLILGNGAMIFRINQNGVPERIITSVNTRMYSEKESSYYTTENYVNNLVGDIETLLATI